MMSIVLVGLVAVETIGLAILWSRYNSIKADITEELIAELDNQIEEEQDYEETEDYDYFRYNYKALLEADIEEIYERMVQALGEADFDTYDELEKDYDSLIEQLKSELELEELLASR
jgi:DNA-binding GntR family transcriptional regulator